MPAARASASACAPYLHEPDAGRVLRPLHELGDALDADREAEAHRHAEDLLGELGHALQQHGAAREHDARRELLEQPGVLDALAHDARRSPRRAAR